MKWKQLKYQMQSLKQWKDAQGPYGKNGSFQQELKRRESKTKKTQKTLKKRQK